MDTITFILEPQADGTLHVPVPEELRHAKFKVVATPEVQSMAAGAEEAERQRVKELLEAFEELRTLNPFRDIEDVVAWQREVRKDRDLPWDDARGDSDESTPRQ